MRIIAGQLRGRRLLPPAAETTRPITDRAKQSLFDILSPIIAGANVYDCFAGTGSMGLECLSREAKGVTFFESDRSALKLLRENIAVLDVADKSTVISTNLFDWFAKAPGGRKVDLIFLDPPYCFLRERPEELQALAATLAEKHLAKDAIVVFRHDSADQLELAPLAGEDVRTYGSMMIELLKVRS
jgi:16S rRNA (guanine(966)-N(2))-methyltransferase RsmD